jgi:hypothetical protein
VTYQSTNTSVVTVNSKGTVALKGVGTAKIIVTAAETANYKVATQTITVKVKAGTQVFSGKTVYNKVYGNKAFTLDLKAARENAKLTYKTSDKKVATVSSKGKVMLKGPGRVTITVTAAATEHYAKTTKKITLTVAPKKAALSSAKNTQAGTVTVTWKKDNTVSGYQIQIAENKAFTKNVKSYLAKKSKTSQTIANLKKGKTYYVRIRSYKTVNKKTLPGSYSTPKKVRVTK